MSQPKFKSDVSVGSFGIHLDPEKVTISVENLFNMNQMQQKYNLKCNHKINKHCSDTNSITSAKVTKQSNKSPIISKNCVTTTSNAHTTENLDGHDFHENIDYHKQKTDMKCELPNPKLNRMCRDSCGTMRTDMYKDLDTNKLINGEDAEYNQKITGPESISPTKSMNNVFNLLMDNRHKVIGANTSGKERSPTIEDQVSSVNYKDKLQAQKKKLEAMVAAKSKSKPFEEALRQEQINTVLNSRAVLMKEMLNIQGKSSQTVNNNYDSKIKTRRGKKSLSLKKQPSKDFDLTVGEIIVELNSQKENKNLSCDVLPLQRRTPRTSTKLTNHTYIETKSDITNIRNVKVQSVDSKYVPLAPIFSKASAKSSGILSASKQKDLQKQRSFNAPMLCEFPSVSHIYQRCQSPLWNLPAANLRLVKENLIDSHFIANIMLTNDWSCLATKIERKCVPKLTFLNLTENVDEELMQIKDELPDFPVFRCFKLFRERNGFVYHDENSTKKSKKRNSDSQNTYQQHSHQRLPNEDVLMWTEKYKPTSSRMIIGNQQAVHMLRDWLHAWCDYTIETSISQNKRKRRDSSDFESDSSCGPDLLYNVMILRGPAGCGKTFTINAICKELSIKVLEINVSSRRTGKRLLQELHEATQSHQVRNKDVTNVNSMFQSFIKRTGAPSTTEARNSMCAIVIDDVDIIFDQDEGFISALNQLILTSKRPIILTATDFHAPYLNKLIMQYPLINFAALSANTLAPYLQILCLVEGLQVDRQSLGELLEWNNGDARRTLLQLQFWLQSGGDAECSCQEITCNKSAHDSARLAKMCSDIFEERHDDYDDFTFLLSGVITKSLPPKTHTNCIQSFIRYGPNDIVLPLPLDLAAFWWNMPNLLGFEAMNHQFGALNRAKNVVDVCALSQEAMSLSDIAKCMDALCMCDTLNRLGQHVSTVEPCPKYWDDVLRDGFHLNRPLEDFSYAHEFSENMIHAILQGSYSAGFVSARKWNFVSPCSVERIWRRTQFDCMGELQSVVGLHKRCDRKAFAIDYMPIMQHIAHLEEYRQNNNSKRSKRFCHYFKTMGIELSALTLKTASRRFNLKEI